MTNSTNQANVEVTVSNTQTTKGAVLMTTVNENMKMPALLTIARQADVKFVVGMTKKQLVRDINAKLAAVTVEPAAICETQVAVTKLEEETTMTTVRGMQLANNMKMIDKMDKGSHFDMKPEKYENKNRANLVTEIKRKAVGFLNTLGELPIHVVGFQWFLDAHNQLVPQGKKSNRYGILEIVVAPGVLQYHVWNPGIKKFEWKDFAGFTADASNGFIDIFHPAVAPAGYNGVLKLPIYHSAAMGGFFVMLPNAPMKDGTFRPIFKVADHRWEGGGSTAAIGRVNAALTAFLRMTQSQFIQANPLNRHGFNESCATCAHSQWLATKDGLMDDEHMEDPKSNVVLNSLSTDESRDGQYIPQMWCTARNLLVDEDIVEVLNHAAANDKQAVEVIEEVVMDNGDVVPRLGFKYPTKGELVIDGEIRKVAGARAEGTKSLCEGCPFYSKSERKSDTRINAEIVAERERVGNNTAVVGKDIFVSKYFTEMVRADRQVVQVLNNRKEWVVGFPGDVAGAADIRIKGIGGLTVYAGQAIKEALPSLGALNFSAPMEGFDAARASDENKIQAIFTAARNFATLTQEKANEVFALAMAKPASLDKGQSVRWDRAVEWLRQSVIWAQEAFANRNRPDFTTKFITAPVESEIHDIRQLHTDDFILNLKESDRQGFIGYGMGYRDLDYKDMVKYLEETISLEIIDHVLETGEKFWIYDDSEPAELQVGEKSDMDLVAGALQHMLNSQINTLLYGIRRDADPAGAIERVKVCEEVKAYLRAVVLQA